jgi:hypothetical protein
MHHVSYSGLFQNERPFMKFQCPEVIVKTDSGHYIFYQEQIYGNTIFLLDMTLNLFY